MKHQPCTLGNKGSIRHDHGDATFTLRIKQGLRRETGDQGKDLWITLPAHLPANVHHTVVRRYLLKLQCRGYEVRGNGPSFRDKTKNTPNVKMS